MAGWHHWLDGCESEWTPGVGDGQGGLACCDSWGRKESDMTERLIWSDLKVVSRFCLANRVPSDISTVHVGTDCWVASAFRPYVFVFAVVFVFSPLLSPPQKFLCFACGIILIFQVSFKNWPSQKALPDFPSRADAWYFLLIYQEIYRYVDRYTDRQVDRYREITKNWLTWLWRLRIL